MVYRYDVPYVYSTPAGAEFGAWANRIEWCQQNCKGPWQYKGKGSFIFCDEKDYMLFLLKWE